MHYRSLRFMHNALYGLVLLIVIFSLVICPFAIPLYPSTQELVSTLPKRPIQGTFTFAFLSGNSDNSIEFQQALDFANQFHPTFILNCSSPIVIGTQVEYNQYALLLRQSRSHVFTLGSEHGITGLGHYIYEQNFTPVNPSTDSTDYAFDYQGSKFILLDVAAGDLTSRQLTWLMTMLHTPEHKIIAIYIPSETSQNVILLSGTSRLYKVLDTVGQKAVDLVLINALLENLPRVTIRENSLQKTTIVSLDQTSTISIVVSVSSKGIEYSQMKLLSNRPAIAKPILLASGILVISGWFLFGILWRMLRPVDSIRKRARRRQSSYGFLPPGTLDFIIGGSLSLVSWTGGALPLLSAGFLVVFNISGCIIFLSGLFLAIWGRLKLGRFWSGSRAIIQTQHQIVRDGPYKLVRHPIYTGEILMAIGTSIWAANWMLLLTLFGGIALYNYYRARTEESLFIEELGIEYQRYREHVPMLIPCKSKVR